MDQHLEMIHKSIVHDMSEGIMTIDFDGMIQDINPAALEILERTEEELKGKRFASCFFKYYENDSFNQAVIDAIYDSNVSHKNIVSYYTGIRTKQLHITTSFLKKGNTKVAVIVVLNDISELAELRDAIKAMEHIKRLNVQLELRNKLLSETFGRFLSDEIVKQLLETPDGLALGGKKRTLTVMMSDLRGFTDLSERMDAQSLISMLNHYLGEMTEIIQKHNGTIIEFIGDGIMAIFGAPAPSSCHASDAVAAAVEMQSRMEEVNRYNESHGFPVLHMGIGINTGEVIVGNIGSEKRTKYGVVGNHVNLCGRIESYTVGGQVLISPMTRSMITEPLEIAGEQTIFPKGVAAPLVISHVIGIGGDYRLCCPNRVDSPVELKKSCPVSFYLIHEKHSDLEPRKGRITAISKTGAVIETEEPLQPYMNLQIDIGGKLFCKVISVKERSCLLRITSAPQEYELWMRQLLQNDSEII